MLAATSETSVKEETAIARNDDKILNMAPGNISGVPLLNKARSYELGKRKLNLKKSN